MSNIITIDEIKGCLEEEGPKKLRKPQYAHDSGFGVLPWVIGSARHILNCTVLKNSSIYYESIAERIKENLPRQGEIILSGENLTVIAFNPKENSFVKTNYLLDIGQLRRTQESFSLDDYERVSPIETIYYSGLMFGGPSDAAPFLELLLKRADVPVLEISRNINGDTCNRCFSLAKYDKK